MRLNSQNLIVVGDRVLIAPEKGKERTKVGLYLPASAIDKLTVLGGNVVEVGPGTPVPSPGEFDNEPWKLYEKDNKTAYVPLQASIGDYALFLKSAAVEVEFEDNKFLIVPHSAILLLVRDEEKLEPPDSM
jgi:co-chaperonin GroES (HSP10)